MKQKILINNLTRSGKLIFFHLLRNENFELVGIVTPYIPEEVIAFIQNDSNHGKFWGQCTDIEKNVDNTKIKFTFADQKSYEITIFDSKNFNENTMKKLNIDILINLDANVKQKGLEKYANSVKRYVISTIDDRKIWKNNLEPIVFGVNHTKIVKAKTKIVYIAQIEVVILTNLIKKLSRKLKIGTCWFQIWSGPSNHQVLIDDFVKGKRGVFYQRSIINNIIQNDIDDKVLTLKFILDKNRYSSNDPIIVEGESLTVPIRGGAYLNVTLGMSEIHDPEKIHELIRGIGDSLIAFEESMKLTSQDVVSTDHFAIIDRNSIKILQTKNNKILKTGLWYDPESSNAISIFKTLEFMAN